MARSRNIKPSFFQDDKLGELSIYSRMAFIGLWTLADYKGCLEFRPKMLKVQLLPYDECDIEEVVNNLEQARFIRYYAEAGKKYIKIVNFEKHQNPHKNERDSGSDIPEMNENNMLEMDGTKPDLIGTTRADSLLLIPSTLIPDSLNIDSGFPQVPAQQVAAANEKPKVETELQVACRETWVAYCTAYLNRYGTEPVRNAKVNSQVKGFVQRIGREESPMVAAHFVQNSLAYYVQRGHTFDCLLADAEKLRTEWATGKSMTATRARQIDKSQANFNVVDEALALMGGENAQTA
jgi:hypothetical protein